MWGVACALVGLGNAAADEEDWDTAKQHWEESARLFDEVGDDHYALLANRLLAWSYESLGDTERAGALQRENLHRARAAGNEHMQAQALEGLAIFAVARGSPQEAVPMVEQAYRIHRDLGDVFRIAVAVCRVARPLAALGSAEVAARVLSSGQALCEEAGANVPWVTTMNEETLAAIRSQLDEAALAEAWEQGRGLTADEAVALAV